MSHSKLDLILFCVNSWQTSELDQFQASTPGKSYGYPSRTTLGARKMKDFGSSVEKGLEDCLYLADMKVVSCLHCQGLPRDPLFMGAKEECAERLLFCPLNPSFLADSMYKLHSITHAV